MMTGITNLDSCPFCGGAVHIVVCDTHGNVHEEEGYEETPWSGLGYQLRHTISDVPSGKACPIATYEYEELGTFIYDTRKEAAKVWNRRDISVGKVVLENAFTSRPKATWIDNQKGNYNCSHCNSPAGATKHYENGGFVTYHDNLTNYCPSCDAKMQREEN